MKKFLSLPERTAYHRIEDVIGCKWSAGVVAAISEGVASPGRLERYVAGISKKILRERLHKLVRFGILTRHEISGSLPGVEYRLTPAGKKLSRILMQVKQLQRDLAG